MGLDEEEEEGAQGGGLMELLRGEKHARQFLARISFSRVHTAQLQVDPAGSADLEDLRWWPPVISGVQEAPLDSHSLGRDDFELLLLPLSPAGTLIGVLGLEPPVVLLPVEEEDEDTGLDWDTTVSATLLALAAGDGALAAGEYLLESELDGLAAVEGDCGPLGEERAAVPVPPAAAASLVSFFILLAALSAIPATGGFLPLPLPIEEGAAEAFSSDSILFFNLVPFLSTSVILDSLDLFFGLLIIDLLASDVSFTTDSFELFNIDCWVSF